VALVRKKRPCFNFFEFVFSVHFWVFSFVLHVADFHSFCFKMLLPRTRGLLFNQGRISKFGEFATDIQMGHSDFRGFGQQTCMDAVTRPDSSSHTTALGKDNLQRLAFCKEAMLSNFLSRFPKNGFS